MSVFTPIKDKIQSKVHHSQYIHTANEPDKADTKPSEPENTTQPETK